MLDLQNLQTLIKDPTIIEKIDLFLFVSRWFKL